MTDKLLEIIILVILGYNIITASMKGAGWKQEISKEAYLIDAVVFLFLVVWGILKWF